MKSDDTAETLQSALNDLKRRVAAFEKAQPAAPEEPTALTEEFYLALETYSLGRWAAARLRWIEPELARLREENAALLAFVKAYDLWDNCPAGIGASVAAGFMRSARRGLTVAK